MATPSNYPLPLTGDPLVDGMTTGYYWNTGSSGIIYWSLSDGFSGEYWTDPVSVKDSVELALSLVSYYTDISFVYTGYWNNASAAYKMGADINVSVDGNGFPFYGSTSVWALGYFPSASYNTSKYLGAPGDVYLNLNSQANFLPSYEPGSTGWTLLLHELGHALGLKHPHDDGGTGRPTFGSLGIDFLDKDFATVMSYNDDYDFNQINWDPATLMVLDVLALQYLYGKNLAANTGDTTYNLGQYDFYYTIWDAGGKDTVDATGTAFGWEVVLPQVRPSSVVNTLVGVAIPIADIDLASPRNLVWLTGDIENASGSNYADRLYGNGFNNSLNGRAGANTMVGDAGDDTYFVDNIGDRVYETTNAGGIDAVQSSVSYRLPSFVEKLVLTGTDAINGIGNSLTNSLTGNSAANTLNGGTDADTLLGGAGDDTYIVDNIGDRVYETTTVGGTTNAGGTDAVRSSVSYTLGSFVEKLVLTGSGTINGTGNSLANTIAGNTGWNVLSGGSGNDTLGGGAGNDTLVGGSGNDRLSGGTDLDIFRFNTTLSATINVDKITDFVVADDTIQLENAVFTALSTSGVLAAGRLRAGAGVTTAVDANDYLIYNSSSGALYYDADGSGTSAAVQFATLGTGLALTVADFFII